MPSPSIVLWLALVAPAPSPAVTAPPVPAATPAPAAPAAARARSVSAVQGITVDECMSGLKRNLKALGSTAGDPEQRDAALAAVSEMQTYAMLAKPLDPTNIDEVDAAERDAHRRAYRIDMAKLLGILAEMEIALLEGRTDDVNDAIRGELFELREAAHAEFQPSH